MSLIQDNLIDSDHEDNHQNVSSTTEIQNEDFNDVGTNTNDQNAKEMNPNANNMNPSKRKRTSPLESMFTGNRFGGFYTGWTNYSHCLDQPPPNPNAEREGLDPLFKVGDR